MGSGRTALPVPLRESAPGRAWLTLACGVAALVVHCAGMAVELESRTTARFTPQANKGAWHLAAAVLPGLGIGVHLVAMFLSVSGFQRGDRSTPAILGALLIWPPAILIGVLLLLASLGLVITA